MLFLLYHQVPFNYQLQFIQIKFSHISDHFMLHTVSLPNVHWCLNLQSCNFYKVFPLFQCFYKVSQMICWYDMNDSLSILSLLKLHRTCRSYKVVKILLQSFTKLFLQYDLHMKLLAYNYIYTCNCLVIGFLYRFTTFYCPLLHFFRLHFKVLLCTSILIQYSSCYVSVT